MLDDNTYRAIGRVAVASMQVDVTTVDLILEMSVELKIDPLPQLSVLRSRQSGTLRKKLEELNTRYENQFGSRDPELADLVRKWLLTARDRHEARGQLIHAQWLFQDDEEEPRALAVYSGGKHGLELIPRNPKKFDLLADHLFAIAAEFNKLVRRVQDARRAAAQSGA